MKRLLMLAVLLLITACSSQPTPTPTPSPDNVAPTNPIATLVPIPTLLPTITVPVATRIAETLAPTTAPTSAGPKPTRAAVRFPAPVPLEPKAPTLFKDGNDIKFRYGAIGKLEPTQCYLLHVELAVPNLAKGNRGDDFLDTANCGNQGPTGQVLEFVLYRGKFTNSPNYGTILAQVIALAPEAKSLNMTWIVRVVQNNGRAADGVHYNTAALSPDSPITQFEFQP
jgi:hypothetical protein